MKPHEVHETLDTEGWLDDSHGPGCYCLRLADPPDDPRAVFEAWDEHFDVAPQRFIDGLAGAERLAYVGGSTNVYYRLQDHACGKVRRTTIMRVYEPTQILGIRPADDPFEAEYSYARAWADKHFTVWCDGELHGL